MTDAEYEYLFRDADPRWKAYYGKRREEYRKEHPRTNFDKWKEDIKPEDLLSTRPVDETKCVWINCNTNCPALNCPANCVGKGLDVFKWRRYAQKCEKWFLQWANAPAKENEE